MYHSNVMHSHDGRYNVPSQLEMSHIGDYQRNEYLYHFPGLHTEHLGIPPPYNVKTYYNTNERDWNFKNNKNKRIGLSTSAQPLFIPEVKDKGSRSQSPTSSKNGSDKSTSSRENKQVATDKNKPARNERRDPPLYPKRRMNFSRNPVFSYRNHNRINNVMLNMSPYSPNSLGHPTHCTAPDRFLRRSYLMEIKHIPEKLTIGSKWDKACFPKYGLYMVGSTMSGFATESSDIDLCLLIRHVEVDQKTDAIYYLTDIYKILEHCDIIEKMNLIAAKVPLLKFRDAINGLLIDLNCNNSVGIRNTHLLWCYGQMDWRVKPLVLVVKYWAQCHNINDAKCMTISSYSLTLMVIHFLQCGVSPYVLPCLHSMYKDKFNPTMEISLIDLHEELEPYVSNNKQTLGELFLQFFQYYAAFDFNQNAISIRLGSTKPVEECRHARSVKNDPRQWKCLCIEEPFDLTNTARSVYDSEKFEQIRSIIISTAHVLTKTKNLESAFKHKEK